MTYGLEPGSDDIEPDLRPTVAVIADGPLHVPGRITVQRADCTILETRNRVTLCRCGASKNKPICDGTHRDIDFRDDGATDSGRFGCGAPRSPPVHRNHLVFLQATGQRSQDG